MNWTPEAIEIFDKYAGKIYDHELAAMLNCKVSEIRKRRRKYNIKGKGAIIYPEEVLLYVKDNFRKMANREMAIKLNEMGYSFMREKDISIIIYHHQLVRTEADRKFIRSQPYYKQIKLAAIYKAHETRSPKIGAIVYGDWKKRKQWLIKLDQAKYRPYAKYLWEQTHGHIPFGMRVDWIDENAPLTVDNLQLIKYVKETIPIGGITAWKHDGKKRELIKTGEGEYQLLLPYLWRKHKGEIPPGMWVEKINPDGPSEIENLQLTRVTVFDEGVKNLTDWYVVGVINRHVIDPNTKEDNRKDQALINMMRKSIELKRAIKAIENEQQQSARGSSSDNEMEGTSKVDDQ